MEHDLKTRDGALETRVEREQPLARIPRAAWVIAALLIAAIGWLSWRAFFYQEEGDPVGSAMLAFEKQNSLTVFSSRFEVVAESTDNRGPFGTLESRQAVIVPATVEYRLDLSGMERDDFTWDAETSTLSVTLPEIRTSQPNIDEGQARVFTDGLYVTRDAAADLARNNSQQASRKATAFAKNPEILALARQAAKEAVRQNLAIPMQVAGYGDVTVQVRFDGQKP